MQKVLTEYGKDVYRGSRLSDTPSGAKNKTSEVHGNFYGTSKAAIEKVMATGQHAILDIDIQVRLSKNRSLLVNMYQHFAGIENMFCLWRTRQLLAIDL